MTTYLLCIILIFIFIFICFQFVKWRIPNPSAYWNCFKGTNGSYGSLGIRNYSFKHSPQEYNSYLSHKENNGCLETSSDFLHKKAEQFNLKQGGAFNNNITRRNQILSFITPHEECHNKFQVFTSPVGLEQNDYRKMKGIKTLLMECDSLVENYSWSKTEKQLLGATGFTDDEKRLISSVIDLAIED